MDYLIYNITNKKVYTQDLIEVSKNNEVYLVIEKYKILENLTDVKIYSKTITDADNGLVYTGKYVNSPTIYFCYGINHIKKRREYKNIIFLKIHKLKNKILKDVKNIGKYGTDIYMIKLLILLLFETGMRLGKREFKIKYETIGAITLEKQHLTFINNTVKISFIGKKKVFNEYVIISPRLITELKKVCKSITLETEIFKNITEYKINNYLKQYDITAKDIRTYYLNNELINFILKFKNKKPKELLKYVASLGNHTLATSKLSYLSDKIIELLLQSENDKLTKKRIIEYLKKNNN